MIAYDVIAVSNFRCVSFVAQFADFVEDSLMKLLCLFTSQAYTNFLSHSEQENDGGK